VRRLFFALVFLNLTYFAWASFLAAPPAPTAGAATAHLPTVKLIEEVPAAQRPDGNAKKVVADATAATTCVSVGPFGDVDNSAKAAAVLKSKGFDPKQRAEAGESSAGFWVFVGGLTSAAETDQALVNIEKNGFKDAILMPASGDGPRRISLGLFSERARADKRAQEARSHGFKADVTERKLPTAIYWVDVATPPGTNLPLQDLFAEGINSRVGVQACPAPKGTASSPAVVTPAATAPVAPTQLAGASKPD
jgi:hypothetical protein